MKAYVTSLRAARLTTSPPRHAIRNAKNATLPHWPGETQTCPVSSHHRDDAEVRRIEEVLAVELDEELAAMAMMAAASASAAELVRSSRHSESPEISALLGSNRGRLHSRVQTYWVDSAVARMAMARPGPISKSSPNTP